MSEIVTLDDLPVAVQSNEMVTAMLDGANAAASRVAPCLTEPTSAEWATATAYAVGDQLRLADAQFVEVTVAGTSGATIPTAPVLGRTVTDGTVTWQRIGPTPDQLAEARLVLIGTIKRWTETGGGAFQSQTAGPFGITLDTRQRGGFNLWPSEIEQLHKICQNGTAGAFSVDTAPSGSIHSPYCSLYFRANYCSCGADIAGFPLYETCD